jgi:hypothetical protein
MFVIVNAYGRAIGLPAYTSRRAAVEAARALGRVCREAYGVTLAGSR